MWSELPEVMNSGILNNISLEARKLHEAMFEVITSEASYLKSLNILMKHFAQSPKLSGNINNSSNNSSGSTNNSSSSDSKDSSSKQGVQVNNSTASSSLNNSSSSDSSKKSSNNSSGILKKADLAGNSNSDSKNPGKDIPDDVQDKLLSEYEKELIEAKVKKVDQNLKTQLKINVADNERTVKLREAEIAMEVGKREEEAKAAALIQRAVEEQKVMKERTQSQVEEAKVLLQVAEQQALTAQKEAEGSSLAELVEKQNNAKAMLIEAQAAADAQLATARAHAEGVKLEGDAEASAIQAKGQAEALVLKEKNQTYQYMGEAGITELVMAKMPEIAAAISAPLAKTEKMIFISQDDATGSKITKDIIKTIATLPDAVEGLTGIDLKSAISKATRL